ncbi:MAG: hypothetical protein ACREJ3_17295 [Polyangiaceae bacterium]
MLARASNEAGVKEHYRDFVRPLLGVDPRRWPRCRGGRCGPCAQTLVTVTQRVHDLLGIEIDDE